MQNVQFVGVFLCIIKNIKIPLKQFYLSFFQFDDGLKIETSRSYKPNLYTPGHICIILYIILLIN